MSAGFFQRNRSKSMMNQIKRFVREEEGVTMVEYGLLAALIAVVSIAVITTIGTNLRDNVFIPIRDALAAAG
jgi:pilus assembly protein Flp/PilA